MCSGMGFSLIMKITLDKSRFSYAFFSLNMTPHTSVNLTTQYDPIKLIEKTTPTCFWHFRVARRDIKVPTLYSNDTNVVTLQILETVSIGCEKVFYHNQV